MTENKLEFCSGSKCAKLSIEVEGEKSITLISKAPPLVYEEERYSQEFTHSMKSPIQISFPFTIKDIEFVSGFWYYNTGEDYPKMQCPMPGTYPMVDAGIFKKEEVTDLFWNDKSLYCFFDGNPRVGFVAYPNNQGFCTYRVLGKEMNYKFSDRQGVLYERRRLTKKISYTVECDACCKDDEILCDSKYYPGYTCYPIPPLNSKLLENKNNIARFWR